MQYKPKASAGQRSNGGLLYPTVLAQTKRANSRYQTQQSSDCEVSVRQPRSIKTSARSSRSKSRKATNRLLLEQISKGHTMGRNRMGPLNTCGDKQYRVHYGADFHDSFCENVDSEGDEKK